jgi:hypothetical protein
LDELQRALTPAECAELVTLTTPPAIQAFLDRIPYSTDPIYRAPRTVLCDRRAHCFDGAILAAALLRRIGYPPLLLEMLPNERDDDHMLALFKIGGYWGAVAKSNFVGLRYREPIHRTLRELALTYFEAYFNLEREKTLRGYTAPLDLSALDARHWTTADGTMDVIAERLEHTRKFSLLTPAQEAGLSLLDERSFQGQTVGTNMDGVFKLQE